MTNWQHGDHSDALLAALLERGELPFHPAIGAPGAEVWAARQFDVYAHLQRATLETWKPVAILRCGETRCRARVAAVLEMPCACGPLFYGHRMTRASRAAVAVARGAMGGSRVEPYTEVVADLLGDFRASRDVWLLPLGVGCLDPRHPIASVDRGRLLRWLHEHRQQRLPSIEATRLAQRTY